MGRTTRFLAGNSTYSSWVTLGIDRVSNANQTGHVLVYLTTEAAAGNGFYVGSKSVRVTRNGGSVSTFTISPGRSEMNGAVVPVSPGDSIRVELDHAGETHTVSATVPGSSTTSSTSTGAASPVNPLAEFVEQIGTFVDNVFAATIGRLV